MNGGMSGGMNVCEEMYGLPIKLLSLEQIEGLSDEQLGSLSKDEAVELKSVYLRERERAKRLRGKQGLFSVIKKHIKVCVLLMIIICVVSGVGVISNYKQKMWLRYEDIDFHFNGGYGDFTISYIPVPGHEWQGKEVASILEDVMEELSLNAESRYRHGEIHIKVKSEISTEEAQSEFFLITKMRLASLFARLRRSSMEAFGFPVVFEVVDDAGKEIVIVDGSGLSEGMLEEGAGLDQIIDEAINRDG